ncbi:MAG: hypothetical protein WCL44_08700 [bacterium]
MRRLSLGIVCMSVQALWLAGCASPSGSTTDELGGTYIPTSEQSIMTVGLDDHDYDLVAEAISGEMKRRKLPNGYVVALGPVDASGTPYDVRVVQLQESLQAIFNQEGTLKFQTLVNATKGGTSTDEIMKIKDFNWLTKDTYDAEEREKLGQIANVNGILVGRVSSQEAIVPATGDRQIMYRFVWKLINTKSGILDISYEYKIGKKIKGPGKQR